MFPSTVAGRLESMVVVEENHSWKGVRDWATQNGSELHHLSHESPMGRIYIIRGNFPDRWSDNVTHVALYMCVLFTGESKARPNWLYCRFVTEAHFGLSAHSLVFPQFLRTYLLHFATCRSVTTLYPRRFANMISDLYHSLLTMNQLSYWGCCHTIIIISKTSPCVDIYRTRETYVMGCPCNNVNFT